MFILKFLFLKITFCQHIPSYTAFGEIQHESLMRSKPNSDVIYSQMAPLAGKRNIGDPCDADFQCISGKCSVNFDRISIHAAVMGNCVESTIGAGPKTAVSPISPGVVGSPLDKPRSLTLKVSQPQMTGNSAK
jgi:hypothetical protein